jgi:hypothetical protein
MTTSSWPRGIALGLTLSLAACGGSKPETKPTPPPAASKDEFQGFGALRTEPPKPKEDKPAQGDGKDPAAKPDDKGDKSGGEGEKTALDKEQVLGAIATAEKRVQGCYKKFKDAGIYVMQITIATNGTCEVEPMRAPTRKEQPDLWTEAPADVDGGKNPKSPTNRCVAAALQQVKFPTFQGKPLVVTYPLILRAEQ